MKRVAGCVVILLLTSSLGNQSAAQEKAKADSVLFLVTPNRILGNPHLDLKNGKYTEIETVAVLGSALEAKEIKLEGVKLEKGKYTAVQCKLSGKDAKPIILEMYFAQKVPEKAKFSNIKYRGEAVATYKVGFGENKDKPLHVFEASK